MIISDMNGGKYRGTPRQLVTQLRRACLSKARTNRDYETEFAERARFFTKRPISTASAVHFLRDAVAAGFFRVVEYEEGEEE